MKRRNEIEENFFNKKFATVQIIETQDKFNEEMQNIKANSQAQPGEGIFTTLFHILEITQKYNITELDTIKFGTIIQVLNSDKNVADNFFVRGRNMVERGEITKEYYEKFYLGFTDFHTHCDIIFWESFYTFATQKLGGQITKKYLWEIRREHSYFRIYHRFNEINRIFGQLVSLFLSCQGDNHTAVQDMARLLKGDKGYAQTETSQLLCYIYYEVCNTFFKGHLMLMSDLRQIFKFKGKFAAGVNNNFVFPVHDIYILKLLDSVRNPSQLNIFFKGLDYIMRVGGAYDMNDQNLEKEEENILNEQHADRYYEEDEDEDEEDEGEDEVKISVEDMVGVTTVPLDGRIYSCIVNNILCNDKIHLDKEFNIESAVLSSMCMFMTPYNITPDLVTIRLLAREFAEKIFAWSKDIYFMNYFRLNIHGEDAVVMFILKIFKLIHIKSMCKKSKTSTPIILTIFIQELCDAIFTMPTPEEDYARARQNKIMVDFLTGFYFTPHFAIRRYTRSVCEENLNLMIHTFKIFWDCKNRGDKFCQILDCYRINNSELFSEKHDGHMITFVLNYMGGHYEYRHYVSDIDVAFIDSLFQNGVIQYRDYGVAVGKYCTHKKITEGHNRLLGPILNLYSSIKIEDSENRLFDRITALFTTLSFAFRFAVDWKRYLNKKMRDMLMEIIHNTSAFIDHKKLHEKFTDKGMLKEYIDKLFWIANETRCNDHQWCIVEYDWVYGNVITDGRCLTYIAENFGLKTIKILVSYLTEPAEKFRPDQDSALDFIDNAASKVDSAFLNKKMCPRKYFNFWSLIRQAYLTYFESVKTEIATQNEIYFHISEKLYRAMQLLADNFLVIVADYLDPKPRDKSRYNTLYSTLFHLVRSRTRNTRRYLDSREIGFSSTEFALMKYEHELDIIIFLFLIECFTTLCMDVDKLQRFIGWFLAELREIHDANRMNEFYAGNRISDINDVYVDIMRTRKIYSDFIISDDLINWAFPNKHEITALEAKFVSLLAVFVNEENRETFLDYQAKSLAAKGDSNKIPGFRKDMDTTIEALWGRAYMFSLEKAWGQEYTFALGEHDE